jgi:imidazolonepropionase-like amidohydrolase
VLRGDLWRGRGAELERDCVVVIDQAGTVAAAGPLTVVQVSGDLPMYGQQGCWVGPGLVDAHVHLAFGATDEIVTAGVVAVRDLGAPLDAALGWRAAGDGPAVAVAGPILTAPGGYPTNGWGASGFGVPAATPADARAVVAEFAGFGVDVIKIALEPAREQPVPSLETAQAAVAAAHDAGLTVTAHALTADMVDRALVAGVDEFAHMPVELLPPPLVDRLAAAGVTVVSTLHALDGYPGSAARRNARALVAAGVPVVYGTDLGNEGTRAGADPLELALLAESGLGVRGAVLAGTQGAAGVAGLHGIPGLGRIEVGMRAYCVVLSGDPLADPQVWRYPVAVAAGGRVWSTPPSRAVEVADGSPSAGSREDPREPSNGSIGRPVPSGADAAASSGTDRPSNPWESVPAQAGRRRSLRQTLVQYRRDAGGALIALLGSVLLGVLVGLLWEQLAPKARWVVQTGGALLNEAEQMDFIAADGWFAVLAAAAGVLCGTLSYLAFRRRATALPIGLAIGGLLGSLIAWRLGRALGPAPVDSHRGAPTGSTFDGPLDLRAHGVLLIWPIVAVLVVLVLTAIFNRE